MFSILAIHKRVALCILGLSLLSNPVAVPRLKAQGATATILGTVTDMSGAAVPDTAVQLKNVNTGVTQVTTTNAQGRYNVPDLGVGDYEVQASKMGFQTTVHKGITLTVGSQSVIDFALPVGQQTQTVTVEGQASQVETTNAALSSLTDQRQLRELPLNGRNLQQLIELAPGVATMQGSAMAQNGFGGRAPEFSVAGSRPQGQSLLLDDESLQVFWNTGMASVTGSSLGIEAIGEFQTLTNTYGAQFGGNGSVINAVSKSGTNAFHGSAYEFLRNSALDSRSFIDPSQIPAFRKNQFGGTVGGPVKKDKAFFFVNYEGTRQVLGETRIALVPGCSPNETLPGLGPTNVNCIPRATAKNPQAIRNTLAVWPAATIIVNGQPEALTQGTQLANENYVLGRFDYNLSEKNAIFARYITDKSDFTEPFGGGGFAGGPVPNWPELDFSHFQFMTAEWRRILSPNMVNVARASFSRQWTNEYQAPTTTAGLVNGVDPLAFFPAGSGRPDGIVNVTGLSGIGSALQLPFNTTMNRFTEADDITWTHGAHSMRFGAQVSRIQANTFMPFFDGGQFSFTGLSSGPFPLLGGVPTVLISVPLGSYPNRDFRSIEFKPYFQDDWKVSAKLALNLGIRYEFSTNPTEVRGNLNQVLDYATATSFTKVPNVMVSNPAVKNFDPRFGFAYDPFADHKTSVRGGFGIFHQLISTGDYGPGFWTLPPWSLSAVPGVLGAVYPSIPATAAGGKPSSAPGWYYPTNQNPYVMQWNFNIQREIARNTVLTVGYVGARGIHLLTGEQQNPPTVCTLAQGPGCSNPTYANGFAGGGYFGSGTPGNVVGNPLRNSNLASFAVLGPFASSRYNSGLVTVNRRFSSNFQAQASYTWSRCMDNGGYLGSLNANSSGNFANPFNGNTDWGPCAWDLNHVFRINGLVALPFHGNRLVEGWQISGIETANSGYPENISDGYDEASGGSNSVTLAPRPDVVPGCKVEVGTINQWFNPTCFSLEAPGTFGNLGRNTLRGPGFWVTDFALLKTTKIRESLSLQFRAEFFNIFNHTNLGLPGLGAGAQGGATLFKGGGVPNTSATQITTYVGTPRQIQFALKLVF